MTVHLTPIQEKRLQHLAAHAGRTPDELVQEEVDRFLAYEEEMLWAVQRGNEDIAAGRVLEHSQVVARIERLFQNQ
jgi:predicted transcriptional regulator